MSLLTFSQQQAIKAISANNEQKYNQLANEVEAVELQKLLGIALLQDVQDNPLTAENILLLDGSTFTDCKGNTIRQKGLRYILAYLNYSEYLGTSYVADTFTGFVKKKREEADTLSEGEIRRLQERVRNIALTEWENAKKFLDENYSNYPLWCKADEQKLYTPKIATVRKTKRTYTSQHRLRRLN